MKPRVPALLFLALAGAAALTPEALATGHAGASPDGWGFVHILAESAALAFSSVAQERKKNAFDILEQVEYHRSQAAK